MPSLRSQSLPCITSSTKAAYTLPKASSSPSCPVQLQQRHGEGDLHKEKEASSSLVSPPFLLISLSAHTGRSPELRSYPPMADSSSAPGTLLNYNHRVYICVSIPWLQTKACQFHSLHDNSHDSFCSPLLVLVQAATTPALPPRRTTSTRRRRQGPSPLTGRSTPQSLVRALPTDPAIQAFLLLLKIPRFVSLSNHVWFARLVSVHCL
jgi:hypothetical protein